MNNLSYTVLSRQSGLSKELTSIANNIANAGTAGYRREGYIFSEYVRLLDRQDHSLSQTNTGGRYLDAATGPISSTGGTFDIAIDGEGFFLVQTPRGERLTRAGAFTLNAEGEITTPSGYALLGEGSSPIAAPPEAEKIVIAPDGSISADGTPIGKITTVTADPTTLVREGDNLFRTDAGYEPVTQPRMRQGYVEGSNVNPVLELSRLIEVQRAYEMGQQLLKDDDERISRTIQRIGQG